MNKYKVFGHATVLCSMVVEAESAEEAMEKASEEFGGLTNYTGMGSCDCLVGVLDSADERCISPDGEVEFDDYEVISE